VKEINGHKYSREEFPEYELRIQVEIKDCAFQEYNFDVYTTQKDSEKAYLDLRSATSTHAKSMRITNAITREQDDIDGRFIEEVMDLDYVDDTPLRIAIYTDTHRDMPQCPPNLDRETLKKIRDDKKTIL